MSRPRGDRAARAAGACAPVLRGRRPFDAGARAAGPHAASHARQPRLRLAPDRAAAAARRRACQRADRSVSRGQARPNSSPPLPTPIPVTIIAELLGVPARRGRVCVDWSHRMVAMYTPRRGIARSRMPRWRRRRSSSRSCATIVAERRRSPRDDLISHLIAAEAAGDKTLRGRADRRDDPAPECRARGDGARDRQCGEGDSRSRANRLRRFSQAKNQPLPRCEEALRFDPPLHFFDRYALEAVEIAGVRFGKGEKIGLLLAAANRDPVALGAMPIASIRAAPMLARISPSAPASISASARRSRGWRCRWRCQFCSAAAGTPACGAAALQKRVAFPRAGGACTSHGDGA